MNNLLYLSLADRGGVRQAFGVRHKLHTSGRRHVNIDMQNLNIDNAYDWRAEYHAGHLLNHCVKRSETAEVQQMFFSLFLYNKEGVNFLYCIKYHFAME